MGRKSGFSEAQIIGAIRELEAGAKVGEVARKMGVRQARDSLELRRSRGETRTSAST